MAFDIFPNSLTISCGVRGRTMPSGQGISTAKGAKSTDKLHILAEFTHFQRHTTFTMDGADYKNKTIHEGVRVLVAVRA